MTADRMIRMKAKTPGAATRLTKREEVVSDTR